MVGRPNGKNIGWGSSGFYQNGRCGVTWLKLACLKIGTLPIRWDDHSSWKFIKAFIRRETSCSHNTKALLQDCSPKMELNLLMVRTVEKSCSPRTGLPWGLILPLQFVSMTSSTSLLTRWKIDDNSSSQQQILMHQIDYHYIIKTRKTTPFCNTLNMDDI